MSGYTDSALIHDGMMTGKIEGLLKPFAPEELSARLRALVRRGQPGSERLAYADLVLDVAHRVVHRAGREIPLTGRECALLELLIRNQRSVVTRESALTRVWDDGAVANVADRYVGHLRRQLGDPPVTQTLRGVALTLGRCAPGRYACAWCWPPPARLPWPSRPRGALWPC